MEVDCDKSRYAMLASRHSCLRAARYGSAQPNLTRAFKVAANNQCRRARYGWKSAHRHKMPGGKWKWHLKSNGLVNAWRHATKRNAFFCA